MQMKREEKYNWQMDSRPQCESYVSYILGCVYKTFQAEYIFRDDSKASTKLVTSQNKQMSLVES